jgi:hypothetical protein
MKGKVAIRASRANILASENDLTKIENSLASNDDEPDIGKIDGRNISPIVGKPPGQTPVRAAKVMQSAKSIRKDPV